jgi:hypothetical protein
MTKVSGHDRDKSSLNQLRQALRVCLVAGLTWIAMAELASPILLFLT